MRHPVDPHARFRQLISDRLDGMVSRDDARSLRTHLAICPRCRMTERGYLRGRQLLRVLRPIPAPRDLWARTSAALDREVARGRGRQRRHRDDSRPRTVSSPALMLSALGSLVLAVIVVGTQLGGATPTSTQGERPGALLPTPFEVPTQALAFVEFTPEGLAIYEATVDRACPAASIDCAGLVTASRRVVDVPGAVTASTLDLHQPNGHLALLTTDVEGRETVAVVFLPPPDPPVAPIGGHPFPDEDIATPETSTSPVATAELPPRSPGADDPSREPASGGAGQSGGPGSASGQPARTPRGSDPGGASDPGGGGTASESGGGGGGSGLASGSGTATTAVVQEVLPDVHVVGAAPAWSADGEELAFSAVPADRSRGPDVYTWRSGDDGATQLTSDHGSYFASWDGSRIVVSRAATTSITDAVAARTSVIDPHTGEERSVRVDGHWLPAVDPRGRLAVVWRGDLARQGKAVVAARGALFVVDWRALDPFAPARRDAEPSEASPSAAVPEVSPSPSGRRADRRNGDGRRPSRVDPSPSAATPTPAVTASPLPVRIEPVEPGRDARVAPVRDWQVRWSDDGSAFGVWISETVGAAWGELAVIRVDEQTGRIDRFAELLPTTLARRAFTLGEDRVAWVAPSDQQADGELRLRTWGPRGFGGLRFRDIDVRSGTPAF